MGSPMSVLRALRLSRAPAAGLSVVGVLWGGLAGLMPDIKAAVDATDAQLGLALLMSALGAILSMSAAPWIGRRMGRHALPVMGLALSAACFYPLLAGSVPALGLALFGVGATVSLLDITANVQVSTREARHGLHLMNINHAMFSFAFGATAYGVGLARTAGAGPQAVLPVLAVIGLVFAAMMIEPTPARADDADPEGTTPRRAPWLAIALTGVILFAAFIGENATEAWSALHIERTLGAAVGQGSFGPATLGLMMGIGRMSGQMAAARLGEPALIFWSAVLGMAGALIIAVAPTPDVALFGVAVTGLGMAVIVPSVNSILGQHVTEKQRSFALSRAWMLGMLGFFIGPAMMGLIAQLFGLRIAFVAVAAVVAVILPATWILARRPVAATPASPS